MDDVKSSWPLCPGRHTCYNGIYNEKQYREMEQIYKICPSSDWSLQLDSMKPESLVIVDQPYGEVGCRVSVPQARLRKNGN